MQDGAVRRVGVEQGAFNTFRMAGLRAAPGAFQMQGTGLEQRALTVPGLGAAPGAFQMQGTGLEQRAVTIPGLGPAPGAFQMQGTGQEQGAVKVPVLGAAPGNFQVLLHGRFLTLLFIFKKINKFPTVM